MQYGLRFPTACLAFGLAACHSAPTSLPPSAPSASEEAALTAELTQGTFTGTGICADCPGVEVQLTFAPNHTLVSSVLFQDREKQPTCDTGKWVLANDRIVHLTSPHNSYVNGPYRLYLTPVVALHYLTPDGKELNEVAGDLYIGLTRGSKQ